MNLLPGGRLREDLLVNGDGDAGFSNFYWPARRAPLHDLEGVHVGSDAWFVPALILGSILARAQ